jgi:modulator of FtsH protease HflK
MPWNDASKPGPWGARPPERPSNDDDGRRPEGEAEPPRRPRRERRAMPPPGGDWSAQRRFSEFLRGPDGGPVRPRALAILAGGAVLLWLLTGVYVVQPNQQGVITTFGAFSRTDGPGLRYHLPWPFEAARLVSVTSQQSLDVGGSAEQDAPEESLMLTGDENIIDLDFSVQWRIDDAADYLFNVRDQEALLKAVAESSMREVVGRTPLQAILTTGRGQVQAQTGELMQRTLDSYGAGVRVVEVQIRSANPPQQVIAAYQDLARATQDAQASINEGNTFRNRVINEAKGTAAARVLEAQAYREQSVREAEGEAARFNQLYEQYRRAPAVTRERLYIETMQRVLAKTNKVVVDAKGASAPLILPPEVFRPRGPAVQAQPGSGQ